MLTGHNVLVAGNSDGHADVDFRRAKGDAGGAAQDQAFDLCLLVCLLFVWFVFVFGLDGINGQQGAGATLGSSRKQREPRRTKHTGRENAACEKGSATRTIEF